MKQTLLIICVFTLLTACGGDEKAISDLTVNPSSIEFDSIESTAKVYVASNTSWKIEIIYADPDTSCKSANRDWCTASILQKFGNDSVEIRAAKNTGDCERIAYVTVYNPEKTIIVTVKVIQKHGTGNFLLGLIHESGINERYFILPHQQRRRFC
ncbi:MAG: BACON domain-containing protein [Prevotellaceae bacterium]|jgi:hypothetical protein|nr:BACON domain-containing protein [Prevotellaceae bacterium]